MTAARAATGVDVPVLPALGLSAATGGALALGEAGLLSGARGDRAACVFAAVSGLDCPLCGMTHAVAALGAGDVGAALAAHPLAPLAVALALGVPLALLRRGRLTVPASALRALALVVVVAWVVRLTL